MEKRKEFYKVFSEYEELFIFSEKVKMYDFVRFTIQH